MSSRELLAVSQPAPNWISPLDSLFSYRQLTAAYCADSPWEMAGPPQTLWLQIVGWNNCQRGDAWSLHGPPKQRKNGKCTSCWAAALLLLLGQIQQQETSRPGHSPSHNDCTRTLPADIKADSQPQRSPAARKQSIPGGSFSALPNPFNSPLLPCPPYLNIKEGAGEIKGQAHQQHSLEHNTNVYVSLLVLILMKKIKSILYRRGGLLHCEWAQISYGKKRWLDLPCGGWREGGRMPLHSVSSPTDAIQSHWMRIRGRRAQDTWMAWVALFNLCSSHPSGEQATPLFSMFLLNDFLPGRMTGTLIICLRKMKG